MSTKFVNVCKEEFELKEREKRLDKRNWILSFIIQNTAPLHRNNLTVTNLNLTLSQTLGK